MVGFNHQIKKFMLFQDNDKVLTDDHVPLMSFSGRAGILWMEFNDPVSFLDLGGCLEFNCME